MYNAWPVKTDFGKPRVGDGAGAVGDRYANGVGDRLKSTETAMATVSKGGASLATESTGKYACRRDSLVGGLSGNTVAVLRALAKQFCQFASGIGSAGSGQRVRS